MAMPVEGESVKKKQDEDYVLLVKEDWDTRFRKTEKLAYPKPLFEAAAAVRRRGGQAKVMHRTVEVGYAPGVF